MMVKTFEVRDAATFIPVVAVLMQTTAESHGFLLRRCGYDPMGSTVLLARMAGDGGPAWTDSYGWGSRTMQIAHRWIEQNWEILKDGDVVDVEFILGETSRKKASERFL